MSIDLGNMDLLVRYHVADLIRDAEHDRLIKLAIGPGRPIRARIADWLYAVADRIEGSPRVSVARAEA
jgi:hypothetical protein